MDIKKILNISNETYDRLKWISLVVLPALVVLIIAIGEIWGFEHSKEIAGTIGAIDTFIGACLLLSSANYKEKQYDEENDDDYEVDIELTTEKAQAILNELGDDVNE